MTINPVLIKSSFALVEPHGVAVAGYFYDYLFEHHPAVRDLFAEHIDEQRDLLWAALGTLVARLDDTETLQRVLRDLGARHAGYGALVDHFPAVGESLLATLAHHAGDAWTEETEASWTALYGVISDTMGQALTSAHQYRR
ncbi:globin domain-containing protein [Kitasatospora sp. NPDC056327]|uniref:globin domain-containing protein n=1 Tax=Kitasatospora sp. NPDC056327 TaxID=3345785 RepID=UPI0035DADD2A